MTRVAGWDTAVRLEAVIRGTNKPTRPAPAAFAGGRRQVSARNKPSSVPSRGRIIHLGPPLPTASCGLPGTQAERATPRSLFGLASGGVCQRLAVTRSPVRSYRTLSPLPVPLSGHRRSTLCCTFRRLTTPGRYPAPCPVELGLSSGGRNHRRSSLARSEEC